MYQNSWSWPINPGPHAFLHWRKTSGVKTRPTLKESYLFHKLEVSFFSKCSILDIWQGSKCASGFKYLRILNMSLVLNVSQSFGYTRVLNTPDFWICQGYTGIRICLNNSWICLIMFGYVWICLNMLEYMWISLNLPFVLHFYISPFVL